MQRVVLSVVGAICGVTVLGSGLQAQAGRAVWLMDGADPQRTSWQRRPGARCG
jgi:hypothetical protein